MDSRLRGNDGKSAVDVIPAKAGIHGCSDQCFSQTRTPNTGVSRSWRSERAARGSKRVERWTVESGAESARLSCSIDDTEFDDGCSATRSDVSCDQSSESAGFRQSRVRSGKEVRR